MLALATLFLGGCVANSSNPTVGIASASIDGRVATLELSIENPGGRHLEVVGVDYELSHGEAALPVADGRWSGSLDLQPGARRTLPLAVTFEHEPIEPESGAIHMNGSLRLRDRTGFLGLKSMDLGTTPFQASATAAVKATTR